MTETSRKHQKEEEEDVKTLACDCDWSNLHEDIIIGFVERIVSMKDFIAFRGVCKWWRSVAIKENSNRALRLDHIVPVFLCSYENDFYSLTKDDLYELDLPNAKGYTRCFSSMGWLLLREGSIIHLFNPLNHARFNLPYLPPVESCYINKFVLSSSPSLTSSYGVMILSAPGLVFYSPVYNNGKWTRITSRNVSLRIADITYCKGQFYAVDYVGCVLVCDMEDPNDPQLRVVAPNFPMELFALYHFCRLPYIVESATGGLLLVYFSGLECSLECRVFEVPINKDNRWSSKSEVKNLGKRSLFLSPDSSSFSIEALVDDSICKANCIYYGVINPRKIAISVHNMDDGKVERRFEFDVDKYEFASWIQPSF